MVSFKSNKILKNNTVLEQTMWIYMTENENNRYKEISWYKAEWIGYVMCMSQNRIQS